MATLMEKLIALVAEEEAMAIVPNNEIIAVGVELVGMVHASSLLGKSLNEELAVVDVLEDKLKKEEVHLQHGSLLLQTPKLVADRDYSANSKIVMENAGVCQPEEESHLNLVQGNINVFRFILLQIIKDSQLRHNYSSRSGRFSHMLPGD